MCICPHCGKASDTIIFQAQPVAGAAPQNIVGAAVLNLNAAAGVCTLFPLNAACAAVPNVTVIDLVLSAK